MATEVEEEEFPPQHWGASGSLDPDSALLSRTLRFVEKLDEQYVCPCCSGVVINPQQASCGHIFCLRCIHALLENGSSAKCPKDSAFIKSNEEHLKSCEYEIINCPNQGCPETLPRRLLEEHSLHTCGHRLVLCPHCHQQYTATHIRDHENTVCPEVKVPCPNECSQMVQRRSLKEHFSQCPELEMDCVYKKYGCSVREKRAKVQVHEDAALNEHLLLVLENNTKLEKQIDSLQQSMSQRQEELQDQRSAVSSLERVVQQVTKSDHVLSAVQRSLEEQRGRVSSLQVQLQQLSLAFGQDSAHTELARLRGSLSTLSQQVSVIEGLKEQLGVLEGRYLQHSRLLGIHVDQLQRNEERFRELESTSYSGKLIWKIRDYQKRKETASRGHTPVLLSPAFYTGRSGYKLSVRAYLNGDGAGRGTHLSLYVVLMRGDFDSLLPWPFRQTVTLSLLDQSPARNNVSESFLPHPTSSSFTRPASDTNVASGFPCFVSHGNLEAPKNATYVKDDTLFIKVKVDTSGLEDL